VSRAQFESVPAIVSPPSSLGAFSANLRGCAFLAGDPGVRHSPWFDTEAPLTYNYALFREAVHPMKTFSAKPHEVKRDWFVIDATDKVLGRVATEVARRLRGKHKVIYTPHVDTGDFIVVVNAAKLRVTGDKAADKTYYRHSGYPGGISQTSFGKMQARFPGRALEKAVKGMLPKGPLGYAMFKKLKVYADGEHPHVAQQPKALEI
jgi:large subunit ribosomal protein L13